MQDIGGGGITSLGDAAQFDEATDRFVPYTERLSAGSLFALARGQADLVSMSSSVPHFASHDGSLDPKTQEETRR